MFTLLSKKITLIGIAVFSMNLLGQTVNVISAPVDHLFVPTGFDNNDRVEVVVTGSFPNPCFSTNKVDVSIIDDTIKINVTSLAKNFQSFRTCDDLKIPFAETINLGSLQAGSYKIVVNENTPFELKDKIDVNISSSHSVDENIYAQVDYVDLGFTGGLSGDVTLVGPVVSHCLQLDRVEFLSNKKDTFSIMPIMRRVRSECPESQSRLEIPVKIDPYILKNDKILLFVRSMEGKAIKSFIQK